MGKKEKEEDHRFTHARLFYGRKQKKVKKTKRPERMCHIPPLFSQSNAAPRMCLRHRRRGNIALSHLQQKEDAEVLSCMMGALTEKEPRRDTSFGIPCSCWPIDKETRPRASPLALAWRLDTRSYFHPVPWLQSYHGHYCSSLP